MHLENLNSFKKELFYSLIQKNEKFYISIVSVDDLKIGRRGLTEDEKKNGLILVFSHTSYKNLTSDDEFLYCDMRFSGLWEDIVIPIYAINLFFDDMYNPNFVLRFKFEEKKEKSDDKSSKKNKTILKVVK